MKTSTASLVKALGFSMESAFGPLWTNHENVMACLRRYCAAEGHSWAFGHSVEWLAKEFTCFAPYDGTGEQYAALACLLINGQGAAQI